jgi:hypothetical protein
MTLIHPVPDDADYPGLVRSLLNFSYDIKAMLVRKHMLLVQSAFNFKIRFGHDSVVGGRTIHRLGKEHEDGFRDMLAQITDMRPCPHAPRLLLMEEIVCLTFHQFMGAAHQRSVACERAVAESDARTAQTAGNTSGAPSTTTEVPAAATTTTTTTTGGNATIPPPPPPPPADSATERKHKAALRAWYAGQTCDCIHDISLLVNGLLINTPPTPAHPFQKLEIKIWNLFGERPGQRDAVLRQPGVLKGLWYDELWSSGNVYGTEIYGIL